jgi:glycosyltransferase involved in cell wall biosynthesis
LYLVFEFTMENPALVSVIIPLFNRLSLIEETLQSVSDQTYGNWEVIVVDDGSTDGSYELVKELAESEPRIKLFQRDREPKGAPVCRNIGIAKSSGNYLIFLDSDDILAPFCLQQRTDFFRQYPNNDFLVFPILLFDHHIHDLNILWNVDSEEDDLLRFLRLDALWQTSGPIYKREALLLLNGFKEGLPFWQDFDLHLRALMGRLTYSKFLNVSPDIFHRRNFVDSISRTIPFVKDKLILQKRIDFYFHLAEKLKATRFNLNKEYRHTVWSVLYFLISAYLVKHRSLNLFSREFFRLNRTLNVGSLKYFLSWCYALILAVSNYNSMLKSVSEWFRKMFSTYLPDYQIISNSTFAKKKYSI